MDDMDELLQQVRELCAGLTVEEIEQQISESQFADRIKDPQLLAQYFFECAKGGGDEEDEPGDDGSDDDLVEDGPEPDEGDE